MVPNGWTATEIGNLATFKSGGTPSKANPDYWGGDYPWISGKDLKQHYLVSSIDTLTKTGFESTNVAPIGASLVLVRGMTLLKDFPVGFATRPLAFNQDIKALIPNEDVDGLFLSYLLVAHKEEIRQLVSTAGHGTGRLETERIRSFPVKVPTVLEQKQIAQILSTWDQAIATTERLLDLARQQKKALMQQLLTGKKRFPRFEGEWKLTSIAQMGKVVSGGTPDTDNPDYWNGDINWLTPTDVTALKGKYVKETSRKITDDGIKDSAAKLLPPGTLLICTRATIGAMAISTTDITTNQGFKNLIPNSNHCVEFLYFTFDFFAHKFIRKSSGSTFLELSKHDFERMEFLIPSLEEQKRIASVLMNSDQEIETLQSQLDGLKQEKKGLVEKLLTGKVRVKAMENHE